MNIYRLWQHRQLDLNYKTQTLEISSLQVHINECLWHCKAPHQPADSCLRLSEACGQTIMATLSTQLHGHSIILALYCGFTWSVNLILVIRNKAELFSHLLMLPCSQLMVTWPQMVDNTLVIDELPIDTRCCLIRIILIIVIDYAKKERKLTLVYDQNWCIFFKVIIDQQD